MTSLALVLTLWTSGALAGPGQRSAAGEGDAPYVLVLGTAQDGGLPQIGCRQPCCERVRADPAQRRLVTSLLLGDPATGKRWLFDASPDLRAQVDLAHGHPPTRREVGARPPLFDGVFLTHAHMGHYGGLLQLGREAYDVRQLPTYLTPKMAEFLSLHGPWSLMVERGSLELNTVESGTTVSLTERIEVHCIDVPHRPEFSDTLAFVLRGPERSLLYLPDIDKWERWEERIEDWIAQVDVAFLDGTFYADGEIPGRSMHDIPHPFVQESLERFRDLSAEERDKIYFTHLNHTNPAADPESEAAKAIRAAGMHVASEGSRFSL